MKTSKAQWIRLAGAVFCSALTGAAAPTCTPAPLPSAFTLVGTLNDNAPTYTGLGSAIRIRHLTLGGADVLVAGVGSTTSGKLEVFLLDPGTGAVLDGTNIGANTTPQSHITKLITLASGNTFGARVLAMGDLNADGVPDIVVGDRDVGAAFVFLGQVDGNGILSYSDQISFPPAPGQSLGFGYGIAMGDLDGAPGDEVVVVDPGGYTGVKGVKGTGGTFIYHFSAGALTLVQTINQPAYRVAVGDVTGDPSVDVIVGATSGNTYVYPGPSLSNPITFSGVGPRVAAANVDGGLYTDLIIGNGSSSSTAGQDSVYSGLISAGQQPAFTVTPIAGLDKGWNNDLDVGDINGDGLADLLIGTPNTQPSNFCPSNVGTAYVFLTNPATPDQPTRYALEPPAPDVDFGAYGWSMGAAAGTRLFLVGETGRNINGVANAGQVYIYKVN